MIMYTADFRPFPDRSKLEWLDRSRLWRIHLQGEMRTPVVIGVHGGSKNTAQMSRVQYDDMIERVSADAADDTSQYRQGLQLLRVFGKDNPNRTYQLLYIERSGLRSRRVATTMPSVLPLCLAEV